MVVWVLAAVGQSRGESPDVHQAIAVKPSNLVFHGVFVRSRLDDEKQYVQLKGPRFLSLPGVRTWYEIYKPKNAATHTVTVSDPMASDQSMELTVAAPAYFSTSAKRLTSGPPSEPDPTGENLYVVYQIDSVHTPQATKHRSYRLLAVPAEQWHHDEYFPIVDANTWLLIEQDDKPADDSAFNILDQFGLNRLEALDSSWHISLVEPRERQ